MTADKAYLLRSSAVGIFRKPSFEPKTGFSCNFLLTKLAGHPNMALVKTSDRKGGGEKP